MRLAGTPTQTITGVVTRSYPPTGLVTHVLRATSYARPAALVDGDRLACASAAMRDKLEVTVIALGEATRTN